MTVAVDKAVDNTEPGASGASGEVAKPKMAIAIPKEIYPGECRVAATPETAKTLQKLGFDVLVEAGAGAAANFADQAYQEVNCQILSDTAALWSAADIVLKVRPPQMNEALGKHETELLPEGKTLISFLYPAQNPDLLEQLNGRKATAVAMDAIPRISRAQKMD
ncbi:MAG TPA: hypothetical protein V6C88_02120, partial [Chroococcidiopsis sp.]